MNWLMAEPACDILAQIAALIDPGHPKTAMFAAPGNASGAWARGVMRAERREGVLLTADIEKMNAFTSCAMPDDAGMARILGYPEPKDAARAACTESWLRVVQACDHWQSNVITEALCSPGWFDRTCNALIPHGVLRVLTVEQTLARRLALRCKEAA
jgi:hypothetical protein